MSEKDIEIEKEHLTWKAAKELGEISYNMALNREQIIDAKFGKIMTFISLIIGAITFLFNAHILDEDKKISIYLLFKLNIELRSIFALVILLLFSILFISVLGQYGFKKEYMKTSKEMFDFFKENKEEYSNINSINYAFIIQYDQVQKSLDKVLDFKSKLLEISHILILIVTVIVGLIFLGLVI
ncbi:hypothetical protein ACI1S4_06510 [Lactococcus petauri]|uniref:hypothetical protein n=1 Tax=Lactococcus petauri TaxID=1940789 RepID=UPI00254DF23A|nr:hypothetical protein [Lactococcus petauri]